MDLPKQKLLDTKKLDRFIKDHPMLKGAICGIHICDAESGDTIYAHLADVRLHPASNMKLLTASAALHVLGKDYTFLTEIWLNGNIVDHVLQGDLYIRGKGDPTLLPEDLDAFAKQIYHQLGIHEISGDIIADDTWYDSIRLSPDMMWLDEHCYYGAQVSALTLSPNTDFDAGSIIVTVSPGKSVGDPAKISLSPETAYVKIENRSTTVKHETGENELEIVRKHGENVITINGNIQLNQEAIKEWIAVWEPTDYCLCAFTEKLKQTGVHIKGITKTGRIPENANLVIRHESIPLNQLLISFMKLSNNGHAETLVKEMGRISKGEGSWEKGMEVLIDTVSGFGIDTEKVLLRDGSGISHVNLIAAEQLTSLLFHVQSQSWFPILYNSLPIGGRKERMVGGTLRERLEGMTVYAKTGTIFGVSTLSGYLQTSSKQRLIFSIMLNNLLDEDSGPEFEDAFLRLVDEMID
ncbi:D-alanyl-D-alanine carboxypeptidase/D-alanyl-D-alanine-endopeptidase [Virgibacillus sp. 179-BFC.A HS]|uniref:D-alanyl-D-alanine carboxypeptidase/D-alanyl-D-alanine-endopeptidase n=1 Tax=Tigheibacillus jepli TaxID=3035914 RepID=A0ABU5CKN3_9BACI|nr:D-alanyl-D-alanine carboxypeptidase/D-alanyl-D-alanine-endopeptidase [Virgibacillus sp. 179-BFC.A HS]MDY0406073.1 D-alanyl-D-alanine carboxypeptidase/D-alanyl-D-alanine-endopeptidase [Virgibacillus sp. 179-BFC.A HS]